MSERLTVIDSDGTVCRANCTISDGDAWDRLAAYEDLGTVEELSEMKSLCEKTYDTLRHKLNDYQKLGTIEELTELVKAKRDGRCVVLPCKVGDTVYKTYFIHKCDRCPNNHVGSCKYDGQDVECPRSISGIREVSFNLDMFSIHTKKLKHGFYLSPEEAEAALVKEGNDERD